MPNRKTSRSTPKLVGGYLSYPDPDPIDPILPRTWSTVGIGSPEWTAWLEMGSTKVFSYEGEFTVRREARQRGGTYWTAYKKIAGRLHNRYIGTADKVTAAALRRIRREFREIEKKGAAPAPEGE